MSPVLPRRENLLGVLVSVTDYAEVTDAVLAAARARQSLTVSAAAVHAVALGRLDPTFGAALNQLDVVTPDGQPVRWGLRLVARAPLDDRVYGPFLTLRVCEAAAAEELPIFLFGSTEATLSALARRMLERIPTLRIAGRQASRFRDATDDERQRDAETIARSGARIVLVGLGCPRQEWWMFHQRAQLPMPLLGVGAAFDLLAGLRPMAPAVLQAAGLEWAFRLAQEPGRLWRRYLTLNPLFVAGVAGQLAFPSYFPPRANDPRARSRPCPG